MSMTCNCITPNIPYGGYHTGHSLHSSASLSEAHSNLNSAVAGVATHGARDSAVPTRGPPT